MRGCPLAVALAATAALASGGARRLPAQDLPKADSAAERASLGRTLFEGKGLCFSCHGKNGEGVVAPSSRLAGRPLTHAKPTVTDLAALIKTGIDSSHSSSGVVMPPRGGSRLTDAEVEAVAWYVLELQRKEAPPAKPQEF